MNENDSQLPQGAILFQKDGAIELHVASEISDEDRKTIILASDFFQYAMQRKDWLATFMYEASHAHELDAEKASFSKKDLRVILGGQPVTETTGTKV